MSSYIGSFSDPNISATLQYTLGNISAISFCSQTIGVFIFQLGAVLWTFNPLAHCTIAVRIITIKLERCTSSNFDFNKPGQADGRTDREIAMQSGGGLQNNKRLTVQHCTPAVAVTDSWLLSRETLNPLYPVSRTGAWWCSAVKRNHIETIRPWRQRRRSPRQRVLRSSLSRKSSASANSKAWPTLPVTYRSIDQSGN